MITGFEEQTMPLTEVERKILPHIVDYIGTGKQVLSTDISAHVFTKTNERVPGARIRKIINYIRTNDLLPCVVATSNGYKVEESELNIMRYIDSLDGRIEAIIEVKKSMERQLKRLKAKKESEQQTKLF